MSLTIVGTPEWRSEVAVMTGGVLTTPCESVSVTASRVPNEFAIPVERPTATAARFSSGARGVRGGVGCTARAILPAQQLSWSGEASVALRFRAMQATAVGMLGIVACAAVLLGWRLVEALTALF